MRTTDEQSLLIDDAFVTRVTESVKAAFAKENAKLTVIIPGGLTSVLLLPLYVSLNKLLKDGVTKRCLQWIVDIIHQFTASVHQEKRLGELIILCMNNNINLSTTNLS